MQNMKQAHIAENISQSNMDSFSLPLVVPTTKLDADQYLAEDIDGVGESLFGSGNLNFLAMQSGQTDAAIRSVNSFLIPDNGIALNPAVPAMAGFIPAGSAGQTANTHYYNAGGVNHLTGEMTPVSNGAASHQAVSGAAQSPFAFAEALSVPAMSSFSAARGFGGGHHGLSGADGTGQAALSGVNGIDGSDGPPGAPGRDGASGNDGHDGANNTGGGGECCGDGTTIINIDNTQTINLGDVTFIDIILGDIHLGDIHLGDIHLGDVNLGDINLGDIIVNLGDVIVDLGDVIVNLGDLTLIDLGDVTNLITTTVENVTNIVGDVLGSIQICEILNLTEITGGLVDQLLGVLSNGDGLTLNLDAVLSGVTDLDLDLISGDTVLGLVDQVVDLSSVTSLLEPVLDLDGLVLADIHSVLNLLNTGDASHHDGDADLNLGLDLGIGDLPLVNGIADVIVNPIEDLAGDVDILAGIGLDLFNGADTDNSAGDQDITLDLGLGLIDNELLGGSLNIPLDPIEALVGDIDLNLDLAVNILGDVADNLVDALPGGSASDTLLSPIGDLLSSAVDGILPGSGAHDDIQADADIGLFGHNVAALDIAEPLDLLEPVIGDAEATLGAGLDLFNGDGADNNTGDVDVGLDLDLDLLGIDIAEIDFIDIPLDPIESLLGDVDLDLNIALDLLNPDCSDGGVNDLLDNNGFGLLAWTDCGLPDAGGILGGDALASLMPEPVGDVVEGLGGILGGVTGDLTGGFFGNGFSGGLFG